MPSFSFILTERCDWNCPYCYFTGIEQKPPSLDVFKEHLPYIKKIIDKLGDLVVNIDIQGGEVGWIGSDILRYFFKTIDRPIVVSTNGMFLDRGYHFDPEIEPYIKEIFLHLNMKNKKNYVGHNIKKGIVHDNMDEMIAFIRSNIEDIFDYVEFEFDINEPRKMDKSMYKKLYDAIQEIDNVSDYAKDIIRGRINERPDHRSNCRNFNHSILIDLVNANICLCQRQLDISIPLTEENLIYRLKTFPKDVFDKDHCDSCTRLYAGKYSGNVIERAMLTRSRI